MFPALLALALSTPADPCPPGNLLAGRRPWAWQDVRGRVELATDGVRAPEGAVWDAPLAIVLDTGAAALTWDLGASYPLAAVWIQADANDAYTVWGSTDGADFRALGRVEPVPGHGLRARSLATGGAPVRYLRFGEGEGDGYYSVAEIQAFCRLPTPYPPAMAVGDARPAPAPRTIYDYWNDATSARWELALAGLGLALLSWRTRRRALRDGLLAALGAIAALTYVNFGFFHFGNFIHDHEWTHYYLGAKYQAELSYDGLYECLATADAEDGLRRRVELRKITNLRTNALERTDDVLAHPERCTSRFTGDRWRAFKRDVAYFRARQSPRRWDDVQIDHGYNATPVWTVAGQALASLAPAGDAQLWALAMLDPLCLLATIAVVWWAFGWRVLCVTLLVFATSFPSRFYWTGGAFLRWDWLFHLVASICCLRKGRHALAGAALAYAALLRVFPAVVFAGPALAAGWQLVRARRMDGAWRRFFAGAAVAGALLVSISLATTGGVAAWRAFARNTAKHAATPLTNDMGLSFALSWRPHEVGRELRDDRLIDPWSRWKQARVAARRAARPAQVILVLGALALLALAARSAEPWVAAALGVVLIPFCVELTSYYYAFVLAVALLHARRAEVGRWLLWMTAFTQLVAWAPLPGMSTWYDEQYTLMSVAAVAAFAVLLWRFSGVRSPPPARPG